MEFLKGTQGLSGVLGPDVPNCCWKYEKQFSSWHMHVPGAEASDSEGPSSCLQELTV